MQLYLFKFMPVVMPAGRLCTLAGKTKTEFQIWQDDGLCATHLGNSSALLSHPAPGVGPNPRGDASFNDNATPCNPRRGVVALRRNSRERGCLPSAIRERKLA